MAGTTQGIGLNTYDLTTDNGRSFITGMSENMVAIDTAITDKVKVNNTPTTVNLISSGETVESVNGKKFASNTDIITDSGSILQSKINRVFYKNMCKEFTSNGGDIVVNNGLEGYLLSATLQGNTKVFKSPKGTNTWTEIPSTETRDTVTYDYKLESTKAIISNNGTKYSFYCLTDDKLNNKVIQLGGIGDIRDVLEIKEDGSGVLIQNTKEVIMDGSQSIMYIDKLTNTTRFSVVLNDGTTQDSNVISDKLASLIGYSVDAPHIYYGSNRVWVYINHSDIGVQTPPQYLQVNPITVRYKLATPIVTTIPRDLCPAILTQATNTFQFGDAVAPTSVTIKAPVTDGISKSYTQTLLNGYTQTVGTATPIVNLLNTGLVRLQMDLTAPSTGLNATIFTLSTELRPVTTQKIPVFVNGVCQLATIDKTTGNVNLPSVPSVSANIYIKTDYRRDI